MGNFRGTRSIASLHRFPVALSANLMERREDSVMLRYDGRMLLDLGEQEFFVVIPLEDVAKLPEDVLDLGRAEIGGPTAFFRQTPSGPALYLEQESNNAQLCKLRDYVAAGRIGLIDCIGDLRAMGAPGCMDAPKFAAFEENDFASIDPAQAIDAIETIRQERHEAGNDHSSLSGPL